MNFRRIRFWKPNTTSPIPQSLHHHSPCVLYLPLPYRAMANTKMLCPQQKYMLAHGIFVLPCDLVKLPCGLDGLPQCLKHCPCFQNDLPPDRFCSFCVIQHCPQVLGELPHSFLHRPQCIWAIFRMRLSKFPMRTTILGPRAMQKVMRKVHFRPILTKKPMRAIKKGPRAIKKVMRPIKKGPVLSKNGVKIIKKAMRTYQNDLRVYDFGWRV